jgi:hypothetical protein
MLPRAACATSPGGHCKFDIASLVVTEWHCFLLRPGDVADCPLGCVAVDAGLLIRGPSSGVNCSVDPPTGGTTLACCSNLLLALAGVASAAARPVD